MINVIRIKNASFYAYYGVTEEEQRLGGKFEIDLDIYTNFSEAVKTDDLNLTINYDDVYKILNKMVQEKKI
jgi:dihydroneopterin aldolase